MCGVILAGVFFFGYYIYYICLIWFLFFYLYLTNRIVIFPNCMCTVQWTLILCIYVCTFNSCMYFSLSTTTMRFIHVFFFIFILVWYLHGSVCRLLDQFSVPYTTCSIFSIFLISINICICATLKSIFSVICVL